METKDLSMINEPSIWKKFCKNKLAFIGLLFISFVTIIAILGYLIIPDDTPFANRQNLEIAAKKPGFQVIFIKKPILNTKSENIIHRMIWGNPNQFEYFPIDSLSFSKNEVVTRTYSEIPNNTLIQHFPYSEFFKSKLLTNEQVKAQIKNKFIEKETFVLGTDRFGRDMYSRMVIGARTSLSIGFVAVLISLIIGLTAGSIAGYFRGRTDNIIMWFVNVTWSVPTLLMVISITMILGKGFWQVFIAVGLTMWVDVARIVRGQVIGIREQKYIEACKSMGFSNFRIITKHIIPNIIGPVIIISAANFASAILIEAGLSFLGVGVQPPIPSWGSMIKDHYAYIILNKAYLALIPGIAIMLIVLAFTFIGNGLRDAFDSKTLEMN